MDAKARGSLKQADSIRSGRYERRSVNNEDEYGDGQGAGVVRRWSGLTRVESLMRLLLGEEWCEGIRKRANIVAVVVGRANNGCPVVVLPPQSPVRVRAQLLGFGRSLLGKVRIICTKFPYG